MARHVVTSTRDGRGRMVLLVLVATGIVAVLATAILTVNPGNTLARAPVVGDNCPSTRLANTTVNVVASPDIAPVIEQLVAPMRTQKLPDGRCLQVTIASQNPAETVAGAQILPLDRAPDLWIPDSSLWLTRIEQWKPNPVASFASSPVVVGTSTAVVDTLGWDKKPPTWDAALAGARPVAAPNIAQDAAGLSAELALWQALGKGEKAKTALAGAVVAGLRAGAPSREAAIAAAQSGAATAPLIPLTEQTVQEANRDVPEPKLVAVYPKGGQPSLDYPVALVEGSEPTAEQQSAILAIADRLKSPAARATVRNAGFRDTGGSTTAGAGIVPAAVTPLKPPSELEIKAVVTQIVLLSAPSRVQVVIDMSGSMRGPAGNGMNRSEFAAAAAGAAGQLMPDVAQVGLWGFSRDLRGKSDRIEYLKLQELGTPTDDPKVTHRDAVNRQMIAMSSKLGGNGTALYSTAVAAMKYSTGLYDPRAGNSVVLFTDGENVDPGGPSIEATVRDIKKLYDPKKPVRMICIGIGADADMVALKKLADAGGGLAFRTTDPRVLPEILFKVMSQRPEQ
jgi:Ca-activated chloride channel family protein